MERSSEETPTLEERIGDLRRVVSVLQYKLEDSFSYELDYEPRSVPVLDAVLTQARRDDEGLAPGLFLSIGGYLGEVIIRNFGGHWADHDGMLCVELGAGSTERTVPVFEWVQGAYEDPRTRSLTYRMQRFAANGPRDWDSSNLGSATA